MNDQFGNPIPGTEPSYGERGADWESTPDISVYPSTPEEMFVLLRSERHASFEGHLAARYTPTSYLEQDAYGKRFLNPGADRNEFAVISNDGLPMYRKHQRPMP